MNNYTPTIRIPLDDLIKFWLLGYTWPNGEVIAVKSHTYELNNDGTAVYLMPVSAEPTFEQKIPKPHEH